MRVAQSKLAKQLQADQVIAGMYVRVHGDHFDSWPLTSGWVPIAPQKTMIAFASPGLAPTTMGSA
jgi:hypothetical protein